MPVSRFRLLVLLVAGMASACGRTTEAPTSDEILWDTWGVPHIYGSSEESLFRGAGWAQMESHGNLILRLYGEARGRAAEYWGEDYLESDLFLRTMGVPARGAEWLAGESEQMRKNLEAFADGINAYAEANLELIDDEVEVVLPVTAADVLAHGNRVIHFTFVTGPGVVRQARNALRAGIATGPIPLEAPLGPRAAGSLGSNTWAIGPGRSASGNAMLLANPHLPWDGLFLFWEAHMVGPGVDVYGTTLVGVPGIAIGFNDRLGWSHTVNTYDGADLFAVELEGEGYRFGDGTRAFVEREESILVRQSDGSLREEPLTVRSSVHGPVVADDGDRAVALRVAGLEKPGMAGEWWDMARATNLQEFEAALSRLQIPMFNVMYADADGHILYVFNGSVPRRAMGDVETWWGVVDGSDPSTLWTEYHVYGDLPRVLDPEVGWLQNANDPPWTSTVPQTLSPADFPAYVAPTGMAARPQRSANMLRADTSITFDEVVRYKHSTVVEMADRVLDELLDAVRASDDATAQEAASVLASWDHTVDASSRGGLLFEEWLTRWLRSESGWSTPWSAQDPTLTPDGIADEALAVRLLAEAAADLLAERGALDIAWGDVHRARRNGFDVPVSGGPGGPHGIFRVANFRELDDGARVVVQGDTYYSVMEFGPDGVNVRVLLAYGNATQPHSAHNGDQLALYARKEMRTPWRTRAEIEANLESRTVLW
jgi:acyl-homoserine-lactone acylase